MFYSILAVLFLIKLFKKSIYHAPTFKMYSNNLIVFITSKNGFEYRPTNFSEPH